MAEHSRAQFNLIAQVIGTDEDSLKALWTLIEHGASPLPQRASGALETVLDQQPWMAIPYLEPMVRLLPEASHNALKRNFMKILARSPLERLPESAQTALLECSFGWVQDPREPIAARVFAMEVAYRLTELYPDLKQELMVILHEGQHQGSAGFCARSKRILKKLRKELGLDR
ncbi:MAG: hypothetical protein AAGB22_05330 [Bacteroidota bacterium]